MEKNLKHLRGDIPVEHIKYDENVCDYLLRVYNPVCHEYEKTIKSFEKDKYVNTLAWNYTLNFFDQTKNVDNTLSQIYSRNKSRNLFEKYIAENEIEYDLVVMSRFDALSTTTLDLFALDLEKLYCSDRSLPRKFIQDSLIILPQKMFLTLFDMYDKLEEIIDNEDLSRKCESHGEKLIVNPENILFAKYLLHYENTDKIVYTDKIFFS